MFTLTAIPVKEGHVSQERIPLRTVPLGHVATLMNGALLVTVADGNLLARQVSLGTLDAATKTLTWRNLELVGVPLPFANPSWSPDGTRFTYMTRENTGPILIQRIVNLSTGTDDELLRHPRLTGCVWGRSRPELFCGRTTDRNTTEIIAIHPDTKSVDHIGEAGSRVIMDHMRADGRTLVTVDGSKGIMLEWDLASSQQVYTTYYPSEDGRMELGVVREGPNQGVMRVRPKNGSEDQWRLLVPRRLPAQGNNAIPVKFTPDSAWIVFHDRRDDGRDSLYRISTQSAELERIGDYPTSSPISVLSISPDGTKFIVNAPAPRKTPELLIMHNPVPAGPRPATTTPTSPRK
jgi:Tol biopolymer transport system component